MEGTIKTILVVDDHEDDLTLLDQLLTSCGYHVLLASNGDEAYKVLTTESIDLVFSDVLMPVVDGVELCRTIKASEKLKHIPVILYTSIYENKEDMKKATEAGADHYIVKPIEPEMISQIIEQVLNQTVAEINNDKRKSITPFSENKEKYLKLYSSQLVHRLEQEVKNLKHEIVKREAAEKELLNAKQLAEITLNSIGDAVIITDKTGLVTGMNPVAEQLTGWLLEEAKGQTLTSIFNIINSSTREPVDSPVNKVFETDEIVYLSEYSTLISRDGTEYQISDTAAPIRNNNEKPQGVVVVFNDVTEQYQLREAAAKSRKDLQAIVDYAPAVIYAKDLEGRYIFINQKWGQLFDIQNEGAIGKTDHEIFPKELADGFVHNDKAVLVAGHALESEEVAPHEDDPHTYVTLKFPLFDENEDIYAICGISTDITERKHIENALQESEFNLLKAQRIAQLGNWKLTPETGEIEGSEELIKLFELGDDELTLDNFSNVVHPDDREYDLKHIQNGIEHGTPWDIEHRLLLKDGLIKWVHVVGEPLLDDDGKTISIIGIVQDITERKQADEIVRRSQKMDALGKLTGGVAHDYNNMLGIILGYSEMLEGALSEQPKLAKYAQEIHHAGERGSKLTKKLLAFTRNKPSNEEVLNINTLLQEEQHMLEKPLTARVKLVFDMAEGLWPVRLDTGDMEDAIINASINSMHAIEGQGQLTIRTLNTSVNTDDAKLLNIDAGDYVLLSIIDTGSGMDEVTKERMFEPFYSTKGEKGTGLGLSQVYGFMHSSGGAIKVDSDLGHGTQLMLYFPRHHEKDSADKLVTTHDEVVIVGTETILLVDDETALLNLTSEILTQQGYHILRAESGKQALEILGNESVDLLLSDVIMPEMDGFQLASIVKKKYPDIKIQLASGFSEEGHMDMVDDILRQNILHKPYLAQTLFKRIRELLG